MKIRSVTDVITNSSSETFIIPLQENFRIEDIIEFHKSHEMDYDLYERKYQNIKDPLERREKIKEDGLDNLCSGDGGDITFDVLSDKTIMINVDENFESTHEFIRSNYQVITEYPF